MNYGTIKKVDTANGIGVRVSLFVSGCRNHCPGCFQPETWDFNYGSVYTKETENEILEALKPFWIKGLSILGGEPFEPENQRKLISLLKMVRNKFPQKNIWCYTGYVYEDLISNCGATCEVTDEMLSLIDVLVDGEFRKEEENIAIRFRGSKNQRLIDMNKTRKSGYIVSWDD